MRKTFCDRCGKEITEDVELVFSHELCHECAEAVDIFIAHPTNKTEETDFRIVAQAAKDYFIIHLEEENKILKDSMRQIADAVSFKGDNRDRTDKDILNDIIYVLRSYNEVFKEENENE